MRIMRLLLWMTMTCWSAVDGGVVLPALTGFLLVVCAADNALAVRGPGVGEAQAHHGRARPVGELSASSGRGFRARAGR